MARELGKTLVDGRLVHRAHVAPLGRVKMEAPNWLVPTFADA
jgi:hypothetical protein